jgi:uncharacterized phage-associated protein
MNDFEKEKVLNALLYVVHKLGMPDYHKTFKVLYFAQRQHLAEHGMPILEDTFEKKQYGPVPSTIYEWVKLLKTIGQNTESTEFEKRLATSIRRYNPYNLQALVEPDMDYLAETEVACLDAAILLCKSKSFTFLKEESHDKAWDKAFMNKPIDTLQIAKAGGADNATLAYLAETLSNRNFSSI